MSYERDRHMFEQECTEEMIRMRTPIQNEKSLRPRLCSCGKKYATGAEQLFCENEHSRQHVISETYLGDGLYASFDGFQFELRTQRNDGQHQVYLEASIVQAFADFVRKVGLDGWLLP